MRSAFLLAKVLSVRTIELHLFPTHSQLTSKTDVVAPTTLKKLFLLAAKMGFPHMVYLHDLVRTYRILSKESIKHTP